MNISTENLSFASLGLPLAALLGARETDAPLPARLQIFKMGENETSQGTFLVDEESLASLSAVQRKMGRERVPIGFEHNLDAGSDEYNRTTEPRPTAARGATVLGVPGRGIFLDAIDWTELGAQKIGDFEDLSPTPIYNTETRRVHGILSASLVRAGSVYGLTLEAAATAQLSAAFPGIVAPSQLKGYDRVVAAFERENTLRAQREGRLSGGRPAINPSLTGTDRTVAAFQAANEKNSEWQRLYRAK